MINKQGMRAEIAGKAAALTAIAAMAVLVFASVAAGQAHAAQASYVAAQASEVGTTFILHGNTYKITDRYENARDLGEATLVKYGSNSTAPVIDTVTFQGKTYEVDTIGTNAFNNKKGHRITSVKLGKRVDELKAKAFYGCSKLRTINLANSDVVDIKKSKKTGAYYIDDVNVGSKAFSGAGTNSVKVKCGSANASYQQLVKQALMSKGLRSSATVVK